MNLSIWCSRIIHWSFIALFALVPLLLTPWNYELFEYNKMMAVYGLTVIITAAWVGKMLVNRKIEITRTPFDIPLLLFITSQLVSALFSIDPHVSWFGYYSRFNGGMWSVISYTLLYYAFVSNWTNLLARRSLHEGGSNLLKITLGSATIIAIYGALERLGIDKHLWVQDVQSRVFSTLGQPNWLASYLVALLPISMGLIAARWHLASDQKGTSGTTLASRFLQGATLQAMLPLVFTGLFFVVLLFTRSRSGLVGLAVADLVFWGLIFANYIRPSLARQGQTLKTVPQVLQGSALQRIVLPFSFMHLVFGLIFFINGSNIDWLDKYFTYNSLKNRFFTQQPTPNNLQQPTTPQQGTLLEYGGTESGTIRKYVWQGALAAWRSSPKTYLIGTGTETFAFAFYKHRPVGHNQTSEWDFLYNKAHNEYLNYLATTGILGLGSYLLFIGSVVVWFMLVAKNHLAKQDGTFSNAILAIALFSGWISVLVTNFFGFSVVTQQLFLFLFPALLLVITNQKPRAWHLTLKFPSYVIWSLSIAVGGIGVFLLVTLFNFWYADTVYATAYRASRAGQFAASRLSLEQALLLNSSEPVYYDEQSTTLAALGIAAAEQKDATSAAELVQKSLKASDTALTISPQNVNFWKSRTKIFYSFAAFDPQFNKAAIEALSRAHELSPNDPKILYNLAILYGREGENEKAVEILTQAKFLRPQYRDVYFALSVFFTEMGIPDQAKSILSEYLTKVDPADKEFQERIK